MSYNCNCMCPLKSTGVLLNPLTDVLEITLPNTTNALQNCDTISFIVCQDIPTTNPTDDVAIVINGATVPILTKFGNNLKQDQINSRKKYCVGFGAETPVFSMLTCIPVSSAVFSTLP